MPFQPYKPTDINSLLANPFAENPIGGSAFGTKPDGSLGIVVKTKDPIITTKKPFAFTDKTKSQMEWEARRKLNENLLKIKEDSLLKSKEDSEKSWWQKQTKTAKIIYVGVAIVGVAIIGFYAVKKINK